ncbi:MAG: SUMF1/EgtB/PvdO family nonheme iron enzyme [Magnetococcus sp. MYC-9]
MKSGSTLVDRYIIREAGCRTPYGDSYLAQDTGSGLPVAIQTVPQWVSAEGRWLLDLRRNFLLLRNLDHPHILKMHALEYDADRQIHFLVQEHAPGVTLLEYRLSRPGQTVALADALAICRQIADGLDHAHRSLLHRSIRPDNVILTPEGHVKLCRFDLLPSEARQQLRGAADWDCTQPDARVSCYMAPEQLTDPLSSSVASDLWGLAVLFYEMVSGRLPFDGAGPEQLARQIHAQALLPIPRLGKRRNRVLARAFARDPGQRFPSAMAFVEGLESPWSSRPVAGARYMLTVTLTLMLLVGGLAWSLLRPVPVAMPIPAPLDNPHPLSQPDADAEPLVTPDLKKSLLLQIESRPTAAAVVLDGKRLGVTPFTVGRVAPGAYHLWLEKSGFKPVDMELDLTQDTIVSMNLDPLAGSPATAESPKPTEGADNTPTSSLPATPPPAQEVMAATPSPINKPLEVQPVQELPNLPPMTKGALPAVAGEATALQEAPLPGETGVAGVMETTRGPGTPQPAASVPDPMRAEQLRSLLQGAEQDVQAGRLTLPKGKSAAEKYQAILRMEPSHPEAREGLVRLTNQLLAMAGEAIKAGHLTQPAGRNACEKLSSVLSIDPQHPEFGRYIEQLVARYLPLAKGEQHPQPIVTLLDRGVAARPEDPLIAAARKALSLPQPEQSSQSRSGNGAAAQHMLTLRAESGTADPASAMAERSLPERLALHGAATGPESPVTTLSQPDTTEQKSWREPITGLLFSWIEQGCFQMGSTQGDAEEAPIHPVCLSGFWIGRHEVTQGAWQRLMEEANPSQFQKGAEFPVDSVSWEMSQRFIQRLNARSGLRFRLPTEAEWEYSCRAGSQTPFHFGNSIHAGKANFNGERDFGDGPKGHYVGSTVAVASYPANRFGLFDMHGNVYEWVADVFRPGYYKESPPNNPLAAPAKTNGTERIQHILRGGAWYSTPHHLRCAARYRHDPERGAVDSGHGFRLLREAAP